MSVASSTTPRSREFVATRLNLDRVMAAPSIELEQGAPQRVSNGGTPSAFKRLRGKAHISLSAHSSSGASRLASETLHILFLPSGSRVSGSHTAKDYFRSGFGK